MNKLDEIKSLASQKSVLYHSQRGGMYVEDVNYLLSIIEQQNDILQSLAYTVLADFTHMSEYHINSTVVELAKKAETLCEMDIKSRASDEVINEHWNLEG